jgi:GDP-L-fucose synthase
MSLKSQIINNQPKYKSYNICTGNTYNLLELAEKILTISGKNLHIRIMKDGMGKEYSGDNAKLISEMNSFSFKNIDECIRDLYNWYSVNSVDSDKLKDF